MPKTMNAQHRLILLFSVLGFLLLYAFSSPKIIPAVSNVQHIVERATIVEGQVMETNDSTFTLRILNSIQGNVEEEQVVLRKQRGDLHELAIGTKYMFYLRRDYITKNLQRLRYNRGFYPIRRDSVWIKNERNWYHLFPRHYCLENIPGRSRPIPFQLEEFAKAAKDFRTNGKQIFKRLMQEADILEERRASSIKYNRPNKLELTDGFLLSLASKSESHQYLMHEATNDVAQRVNYAF